MRKFLVHGIVQAFDVVVGDDDAVAFLGRQHHLIVGAAECRRRDRNFSGQAGGVELPIERDRSAADQHRHDPIRFRRLDLGDGAAEVGRVEREEFRAKNFTAAILDVFLHPVGGDLPVIVVGGERVDLLAPVLHPITDQHFGVVRRREAVDENIAVADAALVRHIVEIQRLIFIEDGPDHFARGGRYAAMHDRDFVL